MKILMRILFGLVLLELFARWVTPLIERKTAELEKQNKRRMLEASLRLYPSISSDLSREEATELEAVLENNPGSLFTRARLLGYYSPRKSADELENYKKHALWAIENVPASPLAGAVDTAFDREEGSLYTEGKALWIKHCKQNPADAALLRNGAEFLIRHDGPIAEQLLLAGKKLQPKDPYWSEKLGHLYHLNYTDMSESASCEKALAELEIAVSLAKREDRFHLQTDLPLYAFSAGQFERAAAHARYILRKTSRNLHANEKADVKYKANTILGRIAVRDGQIGSAKSHLLASADVPGSCALSSFGPDFSFAKEMLERGERETVLAYLEKCQTFWSRGDDKIPGWLAEIVSGVMPEDWKEL